MPSQAQQTGWEYSVSFPQPDFGSLCGDLRSCYCHEHLLDMLFHMLILMRFVPTSAVPLIW